MTQNLLSRLFGAGSIYETFQDDVESNAGGYNPGAQSTYFQAMQSHLGMSYNPYASNGKSRAIDTDDGVPASLMYEMTAEESTPRRPAAGPSHIREDQGLPPRPGETTSNPFWRGDESAGAETSNRPRLISARDKTMWKWANVHNLDAFLGEVYAYFLGNGIYSILLDRVLGLLSIAFLLSFGTYLWGCIDYSLIKSSSSLQEVQIPRCIAKMDPQLLLFLWLVVLVWTIKVIQLFSDTRSLWNMHNFYTQLLNISETELQTISWQEIVNRLQALRDANPITSGKNKHLAQARERMDAHDIANRIMRKENYLIAMINKEVLDFSLPILGHRQLMSGILEWNLSMCIFGYIFDESGQIRPAFVKDGGSQRKALINGLKCRFVFAAVMNLFSTAILLIYLPCRFFLVYFSEYHKNPSSIGSRKYTPYAQWKFREFNELPHIFSKRLTLSQKYAETYVSQFPNDKTMQLARFVSFVSGSFAAVLALISLIDSDLFLGFEITHDRTVLFYLGLFGTIAAVARSMVPTDREAFDPEASLHAVVEYTHYSPQEWSGKFHSHEVKAEFCKLYEYQFMIFFQELMSIVAAPIILWFKLPGCAEQIIDFMKDFSMHIDGVGYVCSFAIFDFERHGDTKYGAPTTITTEGPRNPRKPTRPRPEMMSNDGKMEKSFLNFKASNPDWLPDPSGSLFLQNLQAKVPSLAAPPAALPTSNVPAAFGPRSPYRSTRKVADNSYAAQSLKARRGMSNLESSVNMTSTIYHPTSRPSRIAEETSKDFLGDSFLDTTQKSPPHEQKDQKVSAGVLGLMHQFYQEAGTNQSRL